MNIMIDKESPCSGFWLPISSIDFAREKGRLYMEGEQFNEINGIEICKKYIPKSNRTPGSGKNKEGRVSLKSLVPTFKEHIDTDHFMRNQQKIDDGNLVIVTEKLHGTSGRCAYLPVHKPLNKFQKFIAKCFKFNLRSEHLINYEFVVGSRKVVKSIGGTQRKESKHWYDEDLWIKIATEHFEGRLEKGETVYFEIVGYTPNGQPIMETHDNKNLKPFMDKKDYDAFIARYGDRTEFSYGCSPYEAEVREYAMAGYEIAVDPVKEHPTGLKKTTSSQNVQYISPQNKVFIYRITRTNEDGESIDLSWEQVKRRCEILGVNHVPELKKYLIQGPTDKKILEHEVDIFTNTDSNNFPDHIREGVCVRVENGGLTPIILKHKAYLFRVLEGQIKEPSLEDDN